MVYLIAHRGASAEEPENTLSAIKRAIEIGVDYVEVDVHLSADLVPVVIHDHTLCRTTNAPKGIHIRNISLQQLKDLDAGAWFRGKTTEERVPTLEEVLKLPFGSTGLFIELKDDVKHELSRSVIHLLRKYQKPARIVGSFSSETLEYFLTHYPEQPLIGIAETLDQLRSFQRLSIRHFAVDHAFFEAHQKKSEILQAERLWAFTVDDKKTAERLLSIGIEGIISNDPKELQLHFAKAAQSKDKEGRF